MAQREALKVEKRSVLGTKKIKKLRREGILPGNVYGKDLKSQAVQLPYKDFIEVYKKVHETGLVDLTVEKDTFPVLIHNIQINPVNRDVVHADFFKVNLTEKISAHIPVVAVGEPKAETDKVGLLEQPTSEVEVEALPTDLPEKIEVNVENLAQVDEQVTVADLKLPAGVTVLTDETQVVFKIGELVTKEMEAQAAADEAAAAEAQAEATEEGAEGGTKPEGEAAAGGETSEGEKPAEPSEEASKE